LILFLKHHQTLNHMAWNKEYIFVQSPMLTHISEILTRLKLDNYQPVGEVPLHHSNKADTLFTGFYNGNLLIVHPELPFQFFHDEQSETERLFIETFPGSEIAALVENSTIDMFAYAIIQNGRKVRMKDGCDGEIYHDEGEQLPEEREAFAEQIFSEEELEEMREDGLSEEEVQATIDSEGSWRVPNLISKRYLGEYVGAIDVNEVILTKYERM